MIRYVLLGSGSNGNCAIIESKDTIIAIDFGLTLKDIQTRAESVGYAIEDIKALFITHNHIDHIRSVKSFDENKIYATAYTLKDLNVNIIRPFEEYYVGNFKITPIPTSHDALNSVGFIIEDEDEKMVYMTDTGYIPTKYYPFLKDADHYVLESNHDEDMLLRCKYPYFLKKRILADTGHLSNLDSAEILSCLINTNTKDIVLAHISEEANTKELALSTCLRVFSENGIDYSKIKIQVADRYRVTLGSDYSEIK